MFIKSLADYLVTNEGYVLQKTLFIGRIPVEVQEATVLYEFSGGLNESGLKRRVIELRVIASDYITGDTKINALFSRLAYSNGFTLGDGTVIFNSTPQATPQHIGYDEHLKAVFTCIINFYTT